MAQKLWDPSPAQIKATNMFRFMRFVNQKYGKDFSTYDALYQWSIEEIPDFWAAAWEFLEIKASTPYDQVIDDITRMPGAKWFSGILVYVHSNFCHVDVHPNDRVVRGYSFGKANNHFLRYGNRYGSPLWPQYAWNLDETDKPPDYVADALMREKVDA